jgi:DNA-binding phage protein
MSDPLKAIRLAARNRAKADQAKRKATTQLQRACREAHAEGVTITQIASEAGLSRQGVYDLIGPPKASR